MGPPVGEMGGRGRSRCHQPRSGPPLEPLEVGPEEEARPGDNPLADVGRLDEPEGRVRYLEPEEETALVAACSPGLRPIVTVAIHTGIRQGALLGLR